MRTFRKLYLKYLLLISLVILSCKSDIEESITFYDDEYYKASINEFNKEGISYKIIEDKTISFNIKHRDKVKSIVDKAHLSVTPLFAVFNKDMKDKIAILLDKENIGFDIINMNEKKFGFIIKDDSKYNDALTIFRHSLGIQNSGVSRPPVLPNP